jgi:Insulinase (Peptidase family M16)
VTADAQRDRWRLVEPHDPIPSPVNVPERTFVYPVRIREEYPMWRRPLCISSSALLTVLIVALSVAGYPTYGNADAQTPSTPAERRTQASKPVETSKPPVRPPAAPPAAAPAPLASAVPKVQFEKYTLPNGLQVILHVDRKLPIVHVNQWFHVGSKNEKPGRTGFAHLFEHMMFQDSKNVPGEYFNIVEKAGANLQEGGVNGTTDNDRTDYFATVPSGNLETMLWVESDRHASGRHRSEKARQPA